MIADFNIQMQIKEFNELSKWLEKYEWEIAVGESDYGTLKPLFVAAFEQEPKGEE